MTDKNKSGIRLRHLQQLQQQKHARDLSPGAANRKKIFQKLPYQKVSARQGYDQKAKAIKIGDPEKESNEYEKLVQNLKRKSMQVQLRDNMIQNLNKQIDQLKKELKGKERQIERLNDELKKTRVNGDGNRQFKEEKKTSTVFDSFRDPIQPTYAPGHSPLVDDLPPIHQPSLFIQQPDSFMNEVPPSFAQEPTRKQQNSFAYKKDEPEVQKYGNFSNNNGNTQNYYTPNYNFNSNVSGVNNYNIFDKGMSQTSALNRIEEQPQILSPFMALTNKRADTPPKTTYEPFTRQNKPAYPQITTSHSQMNDRGPTYANTSKSSSNPFESYNPQSYNNSHSSSFSKKPGEFDIFKERKNTEADKFNIFGNDKNEVRPSTKLTIEDSREFKFEDLNHSDF